MIISIIVYAACVLEIEYRGTTTRAGVRKERIKDKVCAHIDET